jgi:dUTP pyrophosphatase
MLKVKIRKTVGTAKLPQKMTPNSSGYDIFANVPSNITIPPYEAALVSAGFSLEIPPGYEAQIRPRSGLALQNKISLLNTPGTIDADFRGEVQIILFNFGENEFLVTPQMRIAQMVFAKVEKVVFEEGSELSPSMRNNGGFGHTGA